MLPLAQIKVKSAKLRKGRSKGIQIAAAVPNKSYFKRDVPKIVKEIEKRLAHAKPINEHFYSILSKSKIGEEEKSAVINVLDKEYLGMGEEVGIFEKDLSNKIYICRVGG